MESSPEAHVERVKKHLAEGRDILNSLGDIHTYPVPNVVANTEQLLLEAPWPNDA
jgi:hypothetical protein